MNKDVHNKLTSALTTIISETNGISLSDTIDLLISSKLKNESTEAYQLVVEFRELLNSFQIKLAALIRYCYIIITIL